MALARSLIPLYLRRELGVHSIGLEGDTARRLEALRGQRVVLTPNHPSYEPPVVFHLSTLLKMNFFWLAAREVFEVPFQGPLVARVGAYSIDRGAQDSSALNVTRKLIAEGRNWLVLFPEGQEHYLHDIVLPFLPGAARLGFGALEDLAGPDHAYVSTDSRLPSVKLVPIALRYYYLKDMRSEIETLLRRLEARLGLDNPVQSGRWHQRMYAVADRVLDANEDFYGLMPPAGAGFQQRLDTLRETMLRRAAEGLAAPLPPELDEAGRVVPLRNRIRKLFIAANAILHAPAEKGGAYAHELDERRRRRAGKLRQELRRVLEFVAMTGDYSAEVQTQERFLDVLGRLELEVFGRLRFVPPRGVAISAGAPLELSERFGDYRADPEAASEAAMHHQEQAVRDLLDNMLHYCTPLPPDLAGPLPE